MFCQDTKITGQYNLSGEETKWNPLLKRISIFKIWTDNLLLSTYAWYYYKTRGRNEFLERYIENEFKELYNSIKQECKEDEQQ